MCENFVVRCKQQQQQYRRRCSLSYSSQQYVVRRTTTYRTLLPVLMYVSMYCSYDNVRTAGVPGGACMTAVYDVYTQCGNHATGIQPIHCFLKNLT